MRFFFAILVGKLTALLTRTLKIGGGSAAPGLYGLRIDPDLVKKLAKEIPKNVVITGTNGKTTTARILTHLAEQSGLRIIRNATGSNLERGIASALILNTSPLMLQPFDIGIWELDEAAFNSVAPKLKPDIIVFLNIFRDQLDRYGEIDSTIKKWQETIKKLPERTVVLVNGDDENTLELRNIHKGKVQTFGVENFKISGETIKPKLKNLKLDFEAKDIHLDGLNGSSFNYSLPTTHYPLTLPIPGIYHIYDAIAAIAAAYHLNLPINQLTSSLINYSPAFGRVEKLPFGYIFLIKNPAGVNQVLETITPQIKPQDRLLIALNDGLADGTDVSWIWDARFELLNQTSLGVNLVHPPGGQVVTGIRAYDMAVRLKYAGFNPKSITVQPNLKKALKEARAGLKGQLFILPTYTALLELQNILAKDGVKYPYWKEG